MENHALPSLSLSPRLGIRGMALRLGGREEFGKFSHSGRVTGKLSTCTTNDLLCVHSCKPGSAYTGRMVNGRIARAASS